VYLNIGGRWLANKLEEEIIENTNKTLKIEDIEDIKV
jgi:hypothetical protein